MSTRVVALNDVPPIRNAFQCFPARKGKREFRVPAGFLAALQPHRQIVGDGAYRDPALIHSVALADGDGVVLE